MLSEQDITEYREQAEKGRKAQVALEFLGEYLTETRAMVFRELEALQDFGNSTGLIILLKVLREFENSLTRYISTGELAEKRLNEDGD